MKSEVANYSGIHKMLNYWYGNAPLCIWDETHTARMEWANVTDIYDTNLDNYLPMCASCHRKFDYTDAQRQRMRDINLGHTMGRHRVGQYNLDGSLVKEYSHCREACRQTGFPYSSISKAISGQRKTSHGFIWISLGKSYVPKHRRTTKGGATI